MQKSESKRCLLTADLHLDANSENYYRWNIFNVLYDAATKCKADTIIILGDLVDKKDGHDSFFINNLVQHINLLRGSFNLKILMGNHDYIDAGYPFFHFLDDFVGVEYITSPTVYSEGIAYLPHNTNILTLDLNQLRRGSFVCLMHETVTGAVGSNNTALAGTDPSLYKEFLAVFSGDIHVPQKIGPVEYIGSPYCINFGDTFLPRFGLLEINPKNLSIPNYTFESIPVDEFMEFPKKIVFDVESLSELKGQLHKINPNDYVKVRCHLPRSAFTDWDNLKSEISDTIHFYDTPCFLKSIELCHKKDQQIILKVPERHTLTKKEIITTWSEQEGLDDYTKNVGYILAGET